MTIREMERADIAVCAEIMRSVYNNELWQCRWTNETAAEYLADFYDMKKFAGYSLEEFYRKNGYSDCGHVLFMAKEFCGEEA